jgi:hypothetical protein
MEYGEAAHDIGRIFPYTKKAPRQTRKQITSVELAGSGLVAGLFYTRIRGNLLTQSALGFCGLPRKAGSCALFEYGAWFGSRQTPGIMDGVF